MLINQNTIIKIFYPIIKRLSNTQADSNQLYNKLKKGLHDITLGNTQPFAEAMVAAKVKRPK